jgi:hypothetical protein
MAVERSCGEQIVWRRLTSVDALPRLRNALCGLLFDCAPELVVSVLLFVDELCAKASDHEFFPITVCLLRATDPHYFRIDVEAPRLVPPSRPGFMDGGADCFAGWGVNYREQSMNVWAYLTLPMPETARHSPPWSRLAVCLPRNPTLN